MVYLSVYYPGVIPVSLLGENPGFVKSGQKTLEWSTVLSVLTVLTVLIIPVILRVGYSQGVISLL